MDSAHSCFILGQQAGRSMLGWMFDSLGLFYGLLLPLTGLAVFLGACIVVATNRRPAVIAAYLVFVPLPFLIGIFGSLHGFISSYSLVAYSSVAPEPSHIAVGISAGLFSSLVGLLVTFPAYFVTSLGLFFRTLAARDSQGAVVENL